MDKKGKEGKKMKSKEGETQQWRIVVYRNNLSVFDFPNCAWIVDQWQGRASNVLKSNENI